MGYTITILPEGKKLSAEAGQTLLSVLRAHNLAPDAPCGGNGKCGKCTVLADGKEVLSCQYRISGDTAIRLIPKNDSTKVLTQGYGADVEMLSYCSGHMLAFDIGTTTVVCYLLQEGTGSVLAVCSCVNPQQSFGADVISRIQNALSGEQETLTRLIRGEMENLLQQACKVAAVTPQQIGVVSVVGNPCMQQLFLGISPQNLAAVPFAPVLTRAEVCDAGAYLPSCGNARLLIVPDISGYVGADTVGCVLSTGIDQIEPITLMVDIGTNGEMVLGNCRRMAACATAAGPALEGARIRFGMRGAEGAIDHVWLEDGAVRCSVIGGGTAKGICGSGLIDAVAVLLESGLVNRRGRLQSREQAQVLSQHLREAEGQRIFDLTDGVYLTQEDIREVQMAKGAIAAGIDLMAAHLGIEIQQIQQVLLAGAFGSYIRPESACRIGLLPPVLLEKVRAVGNAAGSGSRRLACSRAELDRAQRIVDQAEFLELASIPGFQKSFAKNMEFRP